MVKKILVSALAVTALTAMFGTGTASAGIIWAKFHSSQANPVLTTESAPTKITVQGQEIGCSSALLGKGSNSEASFSHMEMNPSIYSCPKIFGTASVSFNTEGCKFKLSAITRIALSGCTNGALTMKWHSPFIMECVVSVPNQEWGNDDAQYTNTPGNNYLEADVDHSFSASVTVSKGSCPLALQENSSLQFVADYDVYANEGLADLWFTPTELEV